ncbi:hypothetical protein [Streptomyces sp. NPDC060184]
MTTENTCGPAIAVAPPYPDRDVPAFATLGEAGPRLPETRRDS